MKLIFERSVPGRSTAYLPEAPRTNLGFPLREKPPCLPELSESQVDRHYTELAKETRGVNGGFYPLGSCTMKYNPAVLETAANQPGFTDVHPLQPDESVQGCLEVMQLAERYLCEITGMDAMTLQPAAGAHGEFTGLLLIKARHRSRGDLARTKVIVPDSAHGTNPASAARDPAGARRGQGRAQRQVPRFQYRVSGRGKGTRTGESASNQRNSC